MVQTFRKLNVITKKTDGKILANTSAFIYNVSGTTEVTQPSTQTNTLDELSNDYGLVALKLKNYDNFLKNKKLLEPTYGPEPGKFTASSEKFQVQSINEKRMFMVMARIFENKDKLEKFKSTVISTEISNVPKLRKTFDELCDKFKDLVLNELKAEEKKMKDIKEDKEYLSYINTNVYSKGKTRKFNYTTVPNQTTNSQQITLIKNVYSDQNVDNDNKTFNGKIKFNNN
jgi:vacuolar-type H+-ATPase subunit I/STV1